MFEELLEKGAVGSYHRGNAYDNTVILGPEFYTMLNSLREFQGDSEEGRLYRVGVQRLEEHLDMTAGAIADRLNEMQKVFCQLESIKEQAQLLISRLIQPNGTESTAKSSAQPDVATEELQQENEILKRELQKLVGRLRSSEAKQSELHSANHNEYTTLTNCCNSSFKA